MPDDGCRGDRATQASRLARGARGQGPARRQRRGPHDLPARGGGRGASPSTIAARTWASPSTAGRSATGSSPATGTTRASTSAPAARSTSGPMTLRRFPVEVEGDDVYVDVSPPATRSRTSGSGCTTACGWTFRWWWRRRRSRSPTRTRAGRMCSAAGLEFGALRRGGGWFRGPDDAHVPDEPRASARGPGAAGGALPRARPTWPRTPLAWRRGSHSIRCPGESGSSRAARRAGSGASSRCATPKEPSGRSSRPCARVRRPRNWRTCSSRPRPTTATSRAATHSTSRTRRSRRSTWPAGIAPRRCWPRCRRCSRSPSGWRSRTPGGIRSTWSRCSRRRSSACPLRGRG